MVIINGILQCKEILDELLETFFSTQQNLCFFPFVKSPMDSFLTLFNMRHALPMYKAQIQIKFGIPLTISRKYFMAKHEWLSLISIVHSVFEISELSLPLGSLVEKN